MRDLRYILLKHGPLDFRERIRGMLLESRLRQPTVFRSTHSLRAATPGSVEIMCLICLTYLLTMC